MTTSSTHPSQPPQSTPLHILFIRHGETQDNIDRVLQGLRDTTLTPKGHAEARLLATKLHSQPIDIIYHSPLTRIVQTITPTLEARPHIPTVADPDLRGQCLGKLEGGSYDSIDMGNPRSADGGPGVEDFDDFVRRLKRVFGRIVAREAPLAVSGRESGRARVVVIATHGVAITSILKMLEDSEGCKGFNPCMAVRGPDAYEVRCPDSDDVGRIVVERPEDLPVGKEGMEWERVEGKPFVIEAWGKKEKAGLPL